MPIFGITASSNMTTKLTDFFQIATTTVGVTEPSFIEFTSIPSTYTHLQIRAIARSSEAGTGFADMFMQFNSDTASNYSVHFLAGNGASTSSGGATYSSINSRANRNGSLASVFTPSLIDILDYANTNKYKTARIIQGADFNGSGEATLRSGNWRSTSAVTSIKFTLEASANFKQYSSFALYGIKG
jgi:hypothetical protein